MKNKLPFIISFISLFFVFSGCNNVQIDKRSKIKPAEDVKKCVLRINQNSSYDRTALPVIDWAEYSYQLKAELNPGEASVKDLGVLFENRTSSELMGGIEVEPGNYRFILNAFKAGKVVLSGDVKVKIEGDEELTFKMWPQSGSEGSARVAVNFPYDTTVGEVRAAYSTEIFANPPSEVLTPKLVAGKNQVVFEKSNLPSGTEQYALFWFYDKAGTQICSIAESIIVVGGSQSKSVVNLTSEDWHTYTCSINLKKNDESWIRSHHEITLVNGEKTYTLKDSSGGAFTASVAEGIYHVCVDGNDTGRIFNSVNKTMELNYYSVSMEPVKRCVIKPNCGIDAEDNYANVLRGESFFFTIEKSQGYDESGSKTMTVNGNACEYQFDTELSITEIQQKTTIVITGGLTPVTYTIRFLDENGSLIGAGSSLWQGGYVMPSVYTVENEVVMPDLNKIKKDGKIFDAWISSDGVSVVKSTEGFYENLTLTASWKDSVSVNTVTKTIYANGISLIICDNAGKTNIYVDFDADGVVDVDDDYQVAAINGTTDFTGYCLRAGNEQGLPINSDFTFTMTGGTISEIWGMGSKAVNKSVLNISGNSKIGTEGDYFPYSVDGKSYVYSNNAKGVMLETITNERVVINGAMNGDYKIVCITPYSYDRNVERCIALIGNNTYATMDKFTCYTMDDEKAGGHDETAIFTKNLLSMKNTIVGSITQVSILLSDPDGVSLPNPDEVEGDVDDTVTGFTLGPHKITTNCSVFSISVTDGTFSVGRETFTENLSEDDHDVEETLSYMAMPDEHTYVDETNKTGPHVLSFINDQGETQTYVYMQIMSTGNQISSEMASDFLSKVVFRRNEPGKPLSLKVNLETVPSSDINPASIVGFSSLPNCKADKMVYLDGSFYVKIDDKVTSTSSNTKTWQNAYNYAKTLKFNNLKGYLMNITSAVENNYVFYSYDLSLGWMGGSRLIPKSGNYDEDTFVTTSVTAGGTEWKWQAGPEAGKTFYSISLGPQKVTGQSYIQDLDRSPASIQTAITGGKAYDTNGKLMYENWNNDYLHTELELFHLEDSEKRTINIGKYPIKVEPNGNDECCIQYLAGTINVGKDTEYTSNGYWNDYGNKNAVGANHSDSFFVEFTPYGDLVPNYAPITKIQEY